MVEHTAHFKGWGKPKESRGSIQGHHRYSRSVNLLLEPHRRDVQWHQTGRTWDNWPTRSMHKRSGRTDASTKLKMRKWYIEQSCFFMQWKHFEVKKWVRSKKKREDVTYQALLQHAKEHEMMVKDFNWHKSNGGIVTATMSRWNQFLQV